MYTKLLIYLLLASFFVMLVGGCGQADQARDLVQPDDVVLVEVDGEPLTLPMLEFLMEVRGVDEEDTEGMRELLDELIRLRAVANLAVEEQISSRPKVRAERLIKDIEVQYVRYLEDFQLANPVSDEEITAVYEAQVERAGDRRFKLVTIEFPEQGDALEQLEAIESGEVDFEQAIERATAEGRVARRTDWIDASQVPGDFAAILVQTEPGSIVDALLPYEGKWLIVQLAEVDDLTPPSLEEVREGIRRTLVRQRTQAMIDKAFQEADITPMLPLEDEPADQP